MGRKRKRSLCCFQCHNCGTSSCRFPLGGCEHKNCRSLEWTSCYTPLLTAGPLYEGPANLILLTLIWKQRLGFWQNHPDCFPNFLAIFELEENMFRYLFCFQRSIFIFGCTEYRGQYIYLSCTIGRL